MEKGRWKKSHRVAILWLLGTFVLGQLGMAVWVERGSPELRDPEYAMLSSLLESKRAEHSDKKLAIFLGSSRVSHGFDAREAGTDETLVVNMGIAGCGPYLQEVILDRLLAKGIKPDLLILEVMHPFFNEATGKTLDHFLLDGARLNWEETRLLPQYGHTRGGAYRRWITGRIVPTSRHQAELQQEVIESEFRFEASPPSPLAPIDSFGFRRKWIEPETRIGMTRMAHDQYDGFYRDFKLGEAPYQRLLSIMEKARRADIEVLVVLTPEGSPFRNIMTTNTVEAIEQFKSRIQQEGGVKIVDARDWIEDPLFYDMHHLLPEGAKRFAQCFRQEVTASYSYSSSSSR
jgi:hypothetical protein